MKSERSSKTKLLMDKKHPLLSIKEVIDAVLKEAGSLPPDVKQALVQARDTAWKTFVDDQERVNESVL